MFDKISGLPAHPLLVHATVVLIPLLILVTLGYALLPRLRPRLDWAVVLLALAAPVTVVLARLSGQKFEARLFAGGQVPAGVLRHQNYANRLLLVVLLLAVLALLMVLVTEGRRRQKLPLHALVPLLVTVLAVVAVIPAGYYVYRTGETGATAVWNPGR